MCIRVSVATDRPGKKPGRPRLTWDPTELAAKGRYFMNRNLIIFRTWIVLIMILLMGAYVPSLAESHEGGDMRLLHYEGSVEILDPEGQARIGLENVRFASGETIQTGKDSMASVSLDQTKTVTLDAETKVEFLQESSHLQLKLLEGALFLNVEEKLGDSETLDIQTTTMTIDIRGTIVYVSHSEDESGNPRNPSRTQVQLLEGQANLDYLDQSGTHRLLPVEAGQKVTISQTGEDAQGIAPVVSPMTPSDMTGFVMEAVTGDSTVLNRVTEASEAGRAIIRGQQVTPIGDANNSYSYPANGNWIWDDTVTLVSQSASKLYDGQPLSRPSNVLVSGLPGQFSIVVYAIGSQTDAGSCENTISDYHIYNAAKEDVTSHFTNIEKINGTLMVNPTPITVWTGSATKYYDGKPLTNPEAGLRGTGNTETGQPNWENSSIVINTALGSEMVIAVSGTTLVHGTNPITGETEEIELKAGQRLTVCIKKEQGEQKVYYQIDTLKIKDLPDEVLILYANNPDMLSKACEQTGWDPSLLAERINALKEPEESTVTENGLIIQEGVQDRLITDSTDVRINIDTANTNYNARALSEEEARFTPIVIDPSISVTATGSQTEVGSSVNGYTISWGNADMKNYCITEDLGTLTVLSQQIIGTVEIKAASDSKTYDGKPLSNGAYKVQGLPDGYRIQASVSGSRTDVGTSVNRVTQYQIYGPSNEDATNRFNVSTVNGNLTVERAPLDITTRSYTKVYDGNPLNIPKAAYIDGLAKGETATITATGYLSGKVGSVSNTYEIAWGTAKESNYYIASENIGTLTITPLAMTIDYGNAEMIYDGNLFIPEPVITYSNGTHAGETVTGIRMNRSQLIHYFSLFTRDAIQTYTTNMGTDAGTYSLIGHVKVAPDREDNFVFSLTGMTLTIKPCELKVETPSASKPYDGTALTAGPAVVTGLADGDTVAVTVTGSQTEVGSSDNTYVIEWGSTNNENYTVTETLGKLTVTENTSEVTLTGASASKVYDGTALENNTVAVSGLPEGFTTTASAVGSQTDAGSSANIVDDGYVIQNADGQDVTAFFANITRVPGTLTVEKAPVTVTTGSAAKPYDGTALINSEVSITGLVSGETAIVTATGSQTDVGQGDNTYAIEWGTANAANYSLSDSLGKLQVTANDTEVILTAESAGGTYNGTALTADRVTASGLPSGFTAGAVLSGSQTDAGNSENTIISYEILDSAGNDVTCNFTNITTAAGTLTVEPALLTITTGSASKSYDGTALTCGEYTVEGLIPGETIDVVCEGTITDVGKVENTCTVTYLTAKKDNYTMNVVPGTLEVTDTGTAIVITAASADKVYDGTALTAPGFTVDNLPADLTLTATVAGSQTDAGTSKNTVTGYTILDAANNDVTASYIGVTMKEGTLTVKPATAIVTTGSATKEYDGTALMKAEAGITGLARDETATVTATGTITDVGSSSNTYTIDWGTSDPANYMITEELGTLEVTVNMTRITVTSSDDYMRYRGGLTLMNSDYKVDGLPEGFDVSAIVNGMQWEVGASKNTIQEYSVMKGDRDVTAYFGNVHTVEGTLTVDKGIVEVWSEDVEKTYDGTPLFGGTIHWQGIYDTDNAQNGISINGTKSVTDVGTVQDELEYQWIYPELADKYEVQLKPGKMTITKKPLTVQSQSAEKVFDKEPLTCDKYEVEGLVEGETITVNCTGSQTEVGSSENTFTVKWGTAKESNYEITKIPGTLTVTSVDVIPQQVQFRAAGKRIKKPDNAESPSEETTKSLDTEEQEIAERPPEQSEDTQEQKIAERPPEQSEDTEEQETAERPPEESGDVEEQETTERPPEKSGDMEEQETTECPPEESGDVEEQETTERPPEKSGDMEEQSDCDSLPDNPGPGGSERTTDLQAEPPVGETDDTVEPVKTDSSAASQEEPTDIDKGSAMDKDVPEEATNQTSEVF